MVDDAVLRDGPARFQTTLWSDVLVARDVASPRRREALERLIRSYWKPVYFYLRCRGRDPEAASDAVQGFFTALLEKDYLRSVERERGKFRTFIRVALDRYLCDEYDRATAEKRGGGRPLLSLDFASAEVEFVPDPRGGEAPERIFRREWALQVIEHALEALRAEYSGSGKAGEFEALVKYLSVEAERPPSYAEVARMLGVSENEVKNRIFRARRRYRDAILREIRCSTETGEEAEEELRDLFDALSQ